jgi:dihydrolipoamide dehydrogenase
MSTFGVEVIMVEYLDHALPMEDPDISIEFEEALKRREIKLHTRCSVEKLDRTESSITATVKPRDGGEVFSVEADKVLVSVGRGPSTDDCGFEKVGIPMEKGFIRVDNHQRTGVGRVRAIGDAVGGLMLAHKASAEGILAVEDIAGYPVDSINYENMPRATYCRPEVASVGLNQPDAEKRYDKVKVSIYPFSGIGKAVIIGENTGFVKLVAAGEDKVLVGAHGIGPHATDLIATAATAIGAGLTAEQFAHIVQAHPTLSECWLEASHGLLDGAINF